MLPAVFRVPFLVNQSFEDYVNQFSNKNIRHLLMSVIGYRYNALSFIYTLGSFASGDCGYPAGGSIQMAKNMEQTFLSLGGKIEYRTQVEKVLVQDGMAKGVKTKNGDIFAVIPVDFGNDVVCPELRHINSLYFYDDVLFVAADNGIGYFFNNNFEKIETGSFNNSIDNVLIDFQENLWFTSSSF